MNLVGRLVTGGLVTLLVAGSVFGQEHGVTRPETAAVKTDNESMDKAVEQRAAPASKAEEEKRWYEKIEIALGATGVLQGSPGAEELLGPGGDVTDGSMSFDLELTLPVAKHGKFYTLFEAGAGDGIDGDIPTLSGFNDDADDDQASGSPRYGMNMPGSVTVYGCAEAGRSHDGFRYQRWPTVKRINSFQRVR